MIDFSWQKLKHTNGNFNPQVNSDVEREVKRHHILIVLSRWNYIRLKRVVALYLQLWCGLYQENYWSTKVITINHHIRAINRVSEWLTKKRQHPDAKKKSDAPSDWKALLLKHGASSPRSRSLLVHSHSEAAGSGVPRRGPRLRPPPEGARLGGGLRPQ